MAAINPFLVDAWNAVTGPMQTASTALIGDLQNWTTGWFVKLVPAYLVVLLLIAMWSSQEAVALRFYRHVLLAAIVYMFIATLDTYNYYVTGVVNGTLSGMTAAVTGAFGAAQSPPQAFNDMAVRYAAIGDAVYKAIPDYSLKGVGLTFVVALYDVLVQGAVWLIFVLYLCSYILTNYVVAYGPIFVAMFFFEQTRPFFDGWFRAIIAGMLTQTFLVGDLALMATIMTNLLHAIGGEINPTAAFAADGDIGFLLWDLMGSFGLLVLFVVIALLSVYLAVSISGGAHAQLARVPRMSSGRTPAPSAAAGSSGPAGQPGPSGGGSVQPAGSGGGAAPPRSYAFQNTTPMGPAP
jgi:type IV secretory pathway VirB6-like protein